MTNQQKKQLYILLGVLVAAIVALLGVVLYNHLQTQKEEAETEAAILFEVDYSDIAQVSYVVDDETITLVHVSADDSEESSDASGDEDDGYWYCAEYPDYDLDYDSVYEIVSTLESVSYSEIVEDAEDASEYGLDSVSNTITLTTTDGTTYTLYIGDENAVSGNYYAMFNDDETIYTIASDVPEAFMTALTDLISDESGDE